MYHTNANHCHRAPVGIGYPDDEQPPMIADRQRHWALRAGRWQGALGVVAVLLFWRFFLFAGLAALALFFFMGRRTRKRGGRRWHRRRRHREVARRALDYEDTVDFDQERLREHQEALAEFSERLERAKV